MRRIAVAAAVAVAVSSAGCCLCHNDSKVGMGWRFEVIKPPVINQETAMLIQQGAGLMSAQPVGSVSGPVLGGTWTQGGQIQQGTCPVQQVPVMVPTGPTLAPPLAAPCGGPPVQQTAAREPVRMTCEEFCELMRRSGYTPPPSRLPMPNAEKKD